MENQDLRDLLTQLQGEIKNTSAVDLKGSKLLRDLEKDISALLERSEENSAKVVPSNFNNMESVISHFEVTHPSLTEQVSKLLEFLSNVGI